MQKREAPEAILVPKNKAFPLQQGVSAPRLIAALRRKRLSLVAAVAYPGATAC